MWGLCEPGLRCRSHVPAARTQMIKPGERATQKPSVFGVALQPQGQQVTDLPERTGRGTSGAIRLDTVPGKSP